MAYFDAHLHLARLPQPLEVARELHERGYRYRAVACEPWEWKVIDGIWAEASEAGLLEGCRRSYGLHPMIASEISVGANPVPEETFAKLRQLLENDPFAQVGEAGLDKRYAGYEPGGAQEKIFRMQAEMALELGRDLQIHCVGDYGRVIKILKEVGFGDAGIKLPHQSHAELGSASEVKLPTLSVLRVTSGSRPVFHRFGGDSGIVKAGIALGALFSIHADSLHKKATREALALIPRAHLLFETDADESFIEALAATRGLNGAAPQACTPRQVADALVDRLNQVQNSL